MTYPRSRENLTVVIDDDRLRLIEVEDDLFDLVTEVYEGTQFLGRIVYRFDAPKVAYYFEPDGSGDAEYLCWQEELTLAEGIYKKRYYAKRRGG